MSRRIFPALLLCLAIASTALAVDSGDQPTPWWFRGLAFHAPFDDPAAPLKLIRGTGALTFTRAHDATHTATYVHPGTGLVTVADNNQLRIEAGGALIEGARTNLLLYSSALDQASWGLGAMSAPVDNAVGLFGLDNTAWTITDNSAAAAYEITQEVSIANDGATYTASIFIKKDAVSSRMISCNLKLTGGTQQRIYLHVNTVTGASVVELSAGTVSSSVENFNSYFWRVVLTVANNTSGNTLATVAIRPAIGTVLGTPNAATIGSAVVGGAQLEAGAFPSSYIPTAATTMIRNVDHLTAPTSGNVSGTAGTVSFTATSIPGVTTISFDMGSNFPRMSHTVDGDFLLYDGTNPVTLVGGWSTANPTRVAARWSGVFQGAVSDGGAITKGDFDGDMNAGANMSFGSWIGGGSEIFGHIHNLRIWNRAFSDTEMQSITR